MNLEQIRQAPWTRCDTPAVEADDHEAMTEISAPWVTMGDSPPRVLSAVDICGDVYVVARCPRTDAVTDCWKVQLEENAL